MGEFEEVEFVNRSWTWTAPEELIVPQIIDLIWALINVIPNTFLIYLIFRSGLHRNNFYFTILNWTVVNIILIILMGCFFGVPEHYEANFYEVLMLIFTDIVIRFIPYILVTFLIYEKYFLSAKCYRISVYSVWGVSVYLVAVLIVSKSFGIKGVTEILAIIAVSKILCTIIFLATWIIYCIRGSNESKYRLSLSLGGLYIITSTTLWLYCTLHIFQPLNILVKTTLIILFYGNGFVNLIIFVKSECRLKAFIYQFFGKDVSNFEVTLSQNQSDTMLIGPNTCTANKGQVIAENLNT